MNLKLNHVVEGEGEVIFLIHGLSDNLLYWEPLSTALKKNYKVVRVDLRGHGGTPLGSDEITIDAYAEDLKRLMDELGIGKVNLIGFSLGGLVAQYFSIKYSDMLSSLVLMSTFSRCDERLSEVFDEFKVNLSIGFGEFYDYMIPKVLCPDVIENNREELEMLKQILIPSANLEAYIKAVEACREFNVDDELSGISIPTLILAGKYDEIVPIEYSMNLQDKIKDSNLIVLDNLKHNLLVGEANVEIVAILKEFYKK